MSDNRFISVIRKFMKDAGIDAPVIYDLNHGSGILFAYVPSEDVRFLGRPGTTLVSVRDHANRSYVVDFASY